MADEEETDVLEGFLCPICKEDLKTEAKLIAHFGKEHTEDQDVLQTLKGLFGKAKKKFVKITEDSNGEAEYIKGPDFSYSSTEPQEMGMVVDHGPYFRDHRSKYIERNNLNINKLLIRLDKLLQNLPSDPLKRKAHEQSVVPWVDESLVKQCPLCANSFYLVRRKHHCRLCGFVMCSDCSHFFDLYQAKKISGPLFPPSAENEAQTTSKEAPKLRRSNSSKSLNSVLYFVEGVANAEFGFRICSACFKLLSDYGFKRENATSRPIVAQFYDRLRDYMRDAEKLLPTYIKMCNSLNSGEATYELTETQALRLKLMKLAESIDSLSKKILILGSADPENAPSGLAVQLQQQIRVSTMAFLRDNMVGMPVPPTARRLQELQDKKRQEARAQIHQEQLEAQREAYAQFLHQRGKEQRPPSDDSNENHSTPQNSVVGSQGWTPDHSRRAQCQSSDPMVQQMENIRNFIKQARAQNRVDEVAVLEANLKDLQEAYWEVNKGAVRSF